MTILFGMLILSGAVLIGLRATAWLAFDVSLAVLLYRLLAPPF